MRCSVPSVVALGVLVTAVLAGCTTEAPPEASTPPAVSPSAPPVTSEPSPTPEDPLLTEAREVYQRYLDDGLEVLKSGVVDEDAYSESATDELAALTVADDQVSLAQGDRASGRLLLKQAELIEKTNDGLRIAACVDNSDYGFTVDGKPVTPKPIAPRLVVFVLEPETLVDGYGPLPEDVTIQC